MSETEVDETLNTLIPEYAILNGHEVVPCKTVLEWGKFFKGHNRIVRKDRIGKAQISTVFLGLDHSFGYGPALWFETMVFGGEHDELCKRHSTWDEAEAGHDEVLALVRGEKSE